MTMDELHWMPAGRLRDLMARREVSPVEVVRHVLDRIDRLDPHLHAFLTVAHERALETARERERDLAEFREPGPLFGIPVSIKDLYMTAGIRTTSGSLIYKDHVPTADSVHAERLRGAGAVIVGKTNTPEFGGLCRTINRLGPEAVSPWDPDHVAGGSSGGAAAAVAAGLGPIALGSDGSGSIRLPAAFCGVFGLHPSSGRVPRHGSIGDSLFYSSVGPITRTVSDAALMLQVLAGPDERDATCLREAPPDFAASLDDGIAGATCAWWSDCGDATGLDPRAVDTARRAAGELESAGARVDDPGLRLGAEELKDAYDVIAKAEAHMGLAPVAYDDPAARGKLTAYMRQRLADGREVTGAEYARGLKTRFAFMREMDRLFAKYTLLLAPTIGMPSPATELDTTVWRPASLLYLYLINFAGLTAATVPCGFVDGLPIGLQIIGRAGDEVTVLRAARAFELVRPWARAIPTWVAGQDGLRADVSLQVSVS